MAFGDFSKLGTQVVEERNLENIKKLKNHHSDRRDSALKALSNDASVKSSAKESSPEPL